MKFLFAISALLLINGAAAFWQGFGLLPKPALKKYNVDRNSITVSGISSGGAMAMQFHMAHSQEVAGASIFAGGPYLCANDGVLDAAACMLQPKKVDVQHLINETRRLVREKRIDDTAYLAGEKAWIFHGTKDSVVDPISAIKIQEIYEEFGVVVKTKLDIPAEHGFPTENDGAPCGLLSPITGFINKCNFSGAYESLQNLYGDLVKPTAPLLGNKDNIVDFNQKPFDNFLVTLADDGYLYVPSACRNGDVQCRLHIAFHGCMSSSTYVQKGYITKTGYMDVAETNNIIILAPQVGTMLNPAHCWDWFGYTGANFANREGPQIRAVHQMLRRIVDGE